MSDAGSDGTTVLLSGLTFPEAPRWRDGKLWFSDFYTERVLTIAVKGRAETVVHVPQRPSGLGWRRDARSPAPRLRRKHITLRR
jgi:sugar lactone lactonase YvrE